jgi:hypothetical protein
MKNITLFRLIFSCIGIAGMGCAGITKKNVNDSMPIAASAEPVDTNVARVFVYMSGKVFINGKHVSDKGVDSAFVALKEKHGTVYYARELPTSPAPAEAMMVIDLVAKYELPVKFYEDKTFTTAFKPPASDPN